MGTQGFDCSGGVLADCLENLGFEVTRQPVQYTGWTHSEDPEVLISCPDGIREIAAKAMIYSPSIKGRGRIEFAGRQELIGVFDWRHFYVKSDDKVIAKLIATESGPAVPLSLEGPQADVASFIISSDDGDWLLEILDSTCEQDVMVSVNLESQLHKGQQFFNVTGSRVDEDAVQSDNEVLICAHYDSIYRSPGANDNGSGLMCAEMVAKKLKDSSILGQTTTVTVAFFGGEELLQLGSRAYLQKRMADGTAGAIDLVMNLDMVGVGNYFWPWVNDDTEPVFREVLNKKPCPYPVEILNPPLAGDHYPFLQQGIPAACFIWWPDPNYHQSTDRYEELDREKIKYTAEICVSFVERFISENLK